MYALLFDGKIQLPKQKCPGVNGKNGNDFTPKNPKL
jgi:hypothetical protein